MKTGANSGPGKAYNLRITTGKVPHRAPAPNKSSRALSKGDIPATAKIPAMQHRAETRRARDHTASGHAIMQTTTCVCRGSRYRGKLVLHIVFPCHAESRTPDSCFGPLFWHPFSVSPTPKQYAVALAPTLHPARPLPRLHCARAVAPPMRAYACPFPCRSGLLSHPAGVG